MTDDPALSVAALEDIVAELQKRPLAFALYVSHVLGGGYIPHGDVASEDREKFYGSRDNDPAFAASSFCKGIQECLTDVLDNGDDQDIDVDAIVRLSGTIQKLNEALFDALKGRR